MLGSCFDLIFMVLGFCKWYPSYTRHNGKRTVIIQNHYETKKKFFFEFFVLWVFLSFVRVANVVESIEFLKVGSKMIVFVDDEDDVLLPQVVFGAEIVPFSYDAQSHASLLWVGLN